MKVIRKGSEEPFQDLFPGTYEFKLCGGSILPEDRVGPDEQVKEAGCPAHTSWDEGEEQEADGGAAAGKEEQ